MINVVKGVCRRMRGRKGFTIAEVMVAAFIVLVAVGGLATTFVMAVRTNRFASNYYNAACLARNRIQLVKTVRFDMLGLTNGGIREVRGPVDKDGNTPESGSFDPTMIYERECIVTNSSQFCYDVTVKVYYPISPGVLTDVPVEMKTRVCNQLEN